MFLPLIPALSPYHYLAEDYLTAEEKARAVLWMRRNADSIEWWLLSTPELRRCRFHRYLCKTGRLHEDEEMRS